MAPINAETLIKVSTDGKWPTTRFQLYACFDHYEPYESSILIDTLAAAAHFVDNFYPALNSKRKLLTNFYTPSATMPDGKQLPVIVWNGNIVPDATTFQKMFEEQMPKSRYEVQSHDCNVLNPDYIPEGGTGGDAAAGRNMTILVTVSGNVRYGEAGAQTTRGFSENFVLVPNHTKGRHPKEWLIQSQNFRFVV